MLDAASPLVGFDKPPERPASPSRSNRSLVERELVASLAMCRRIAGKRLRSAVDAEEIVQAYALRALERADQLRDPLAVRAWLRRIFETALVDFCRGRSRRSAREVPFEIECHDKAEAGEADAGGVDAPAMVRSLLPRLRPDYSEILCKIDLLDRPRAGVAAELGVTVNNLTVRLHRARTALRHQAGIAATGMAGLGAVTAAV